MDGCHGVYIGCVKEYGLAVGGEGEEAEAGGGGSYAVGGSDCIVVAIGAPTGVLVVDAFHVVGVFLVHEDALR